MKKAAVKKLKKLSQRECANAIVEEISKHTADIPELDGLYRLHQRLEGLLDKSQNEPPHGESDGTMDDHHFRKTREVQRAAQNLIWAIDRFHFGTGRP